jgi:dTDP-4-dehydrorhamnose reductase
VDKILVAGIDTVVGANLAAELAQRYHIIGLSFGELIDIAGCETAVCDSDDSEAARHWVATQRPQWIVFCGPASQSAWSLPDGSHLRPEAVARVRPWAAASAEFDCEFTLVSSDAVFTGPWMFHRESGNSFCDTNPARVLRLIEKEVADANPEACIIRTNVFGWSPSSDSPSFVNSLVDALQNEQPFEADCVCHATPILATDFAGILARSFEHRLRGLFHLGGGERINPFRFASLLADEFHLNPASLIPVESASEDRKEFGCGETSLQTRKLRKALEIAPPLIREGLVRLHDQYGSGYLDRFGAPLPLVAEKVA